MFDKFEDITQRILEKITYLNTYEGSFTRDIISSVALEIDTAYRELEKLFSLFFLDGLAGDYLTVRASEYGINRKGGTKATGHVLFTGEDDTTINSGSIVSTKSGLLFETLSDIIIKNGSASVLVTALENGNQYNVQKGAVSEISVAVAGVYSVTNLSDFYGGAHSETDDELLTRLLDYLQKPATSGNINHYINWAKEVLGVSNVRVFPLHFGNGTVMIQVLSADNALPTEQLLSDVYLHIEENRPIGASVTVQAPETVGINIKATILTNGDHSQIVEEYRKSLSEYIRQIVFNKNIVDYYRCISLLYDIEEVLEVSSFSINGKSESIRLLDTEIPVLLDVEVV